MCVIHSYQPLSRFKTVQRESCQSEKKLENLCWYDIGKNGWEPGILDFLHRPCLHPECSSSSEMQHIMCSKKDLQRVHHSSIINNKNNNICDLLHVWIKGNMENIIHSRRNELFEIVATNSNLMILIIKYEFTSQDAHLALFFLRYNLNLFR